jgi:hypothetical protein
MTRAWLVAVLLVCACKHDKPRPQPGTDTGSGSGAGSGSAVATVSGDYVELDGHQPIGPAMAQYAKSAIAAGKQPYAYLHASWCKPCQAIAETRTTDGRMQDAFAGTFLVALDIDRIPEQQLIDQSLPFEVIPVFYHLGADGVPDGPSIDGGAWGDNTPANMAPPLKAFFSH